MVVTWLTRWPVALLLFNVVLFGTHLPATIDSLKVTQLGSFAVDVAHLFAALVWWFPAMRREPERGAPRAGPRVLPVRLEHADVRAGDVPRVLPAALYGLYELAPPLWLGFDPIRDQQLAGVLMNTVGGLVLWTIIAIGFMRWAKAEERADELARRDRASARRARHSGAAAGHSGCSACVAARVRERTTRAGTPTATPSE
jgi:cytochrome c oxidase assembly factor CtaG